MVDQEAYEGLCNGGHSHSVPVDPAKRAGDEVTCERCDTVLVLRLIAGYLCPVEPEPPRLLS
jgi:hypothetical protein